MREVNAVHLFTSKMDALMSVLQGCPEPYTDTVYAVIFLPNNRINSIAMYGSGQPYCSAHPCLCAAACRDDPNAGDQQVFCPSSDGWPPFMRVNPGGMPVIVLPLPLPLPLCVECVVSMNLCLLTCGVVRVICACDTVHGVRWCLFATAALCVECVGACLLLLHCVWGALVLVCYCCTVCGVRWCLFATAALCMECVSSLDA